MKREVSDDKPAASTTPASPALAPTPSDSAFAALGLHEPLLSSLASLGYEEPTPIQRAAIPPLIEGKDLLGQAATGTGKTAAFTLPLLERISARQKSADGGRAPRALVALVLVPTRELAMQVCEAVNRYGQGLGGAAHAVAIYGGAPMQPQIKALARGVSVVVATPGRALDHLRRKTLVLDHVEMLVLDEADEMLDMGFADDLEAILTATPPTRQTALLSATLPPRIQAIAGKHLRDPVRVTIARERVAVGEMPRVKQVAYVVVRAFKLVALARVIELEAPPAAIVFCRTRTEVDEITDALKLRGHNAEALHGGLSQAERDRVMKRFRGGACQLLIATDVAARGLDIEQVSHVINYDVPSAAEAYVHRIGRTGRAGREGVAITITEPREQRLLGNIEHLTRQKMELTPVPSVAALRERRLERLAARVEAKLVEAHKSAEAMALFRPVVEKLAARFPAIDVAAASLAVLQSDRAATSIDDEIEVPQPRPSMPKPDGWKKTGTATSRTGKPSHGVTAADLGAPPSRGRTSTGTGASSAPSGTGAAARSPRPGAAPRIETARLWVGAGSEAGIRPADLVGAIANEANVPSRVIGAIQISERFSLVEVPVELADGIAHTLRNTKIKGRKVVVRRDRAVPRRD